jgi:Zinc knuckle
MEVKKEPPKKRQRSVGVVQIHGYGSIKVEQGRRARPVQNGFNNSFHKSPFRSTEKQNTICLGCRKYGHMLRECPNRSSDQKTNICNKCGSDQHRLKDCKETGSELSFVTCFVCKGKGHLSKDCPDGTGLYPKGGSCKLCGKTNHFAKDCDRNNVASADSSSDVKQSFVKKIDVSRSSSMKFGDDLENNIEIEAQPQRKERDSSNSNKQAFYKSHMQSKRGRR